MKASLIAASALLCVSFTSAEALADATLIYDEGGGRNFLRIAGGKVGLDTQRDASWMLFDAGSREMTIVEPAKKEYTVMDEATLDELQGTVDAVMSEMQAQLADLPPAMQEQMRQMMGGMLPDPAGSKTVRLESTGRRGQAAGHSCVFSRVVVGDEVQSEICLAPASDLGLPAADRAAVEAWQTFARAMAERASRYVSLDAGVFGDKGQLPLIYSHPGTGHDGVLQRVAADAIEPAHMQVPAGYRQNKLEIPAP